MTVVNPLGTRPVFAARALHQEFKGAVDPLLKSGPLAAGTLGAGSASDRGADDFMGSFADERDRCRNHPRGCPAHRPGSLPARLSQTPARMRVTVQVRKRSSSHAGVQGNHPTTCRRAVCCATSVSRYARAHLPRRKRVLFPLRRTGPKGAAASLSEVDRGTTALADIAATPRKPLPAVAPARPEAIQPYSYAGTMGLVQGESMADPVFQQTRRGAPGPHHLFCNAGVEATDPDTYGAKVGMRVEFFAESQADPHLGQQFHCKLEPAFLALSRRRPSGPGRSRSSA